MQPRHPAPTFRETLLGLRAANLRRVWHRTCELATLTATAAGRDHPGLRCHLTAALQHLAECAPEPPHAIGTTAGNRIRVRFVTGSEAQIPSDVLGRSGVR